MPEAQKGIKQLVIFAKPRIGGIVRTQTDIKNNFSNFFVSDGATPLTWSLEFRDSKGVVTTLLLDSGLSTDSLLYFLPTNTFWDTFASYTVMLFWEIGVDLEKIYSENSIQLQIKDLHDGP